MNSEKLKSLINNFRGVKKDHSIEPAPARKYLKDSFDLLQSLEQDRPAALRMASKFTADANSLSDADAVWLAKETHQMLSAPWTKPLIKLNFFKSCIRAPKKK